MADGRLARVVMAGTEGNQVTVSQVFAMTEPQNLETRAQLNLAAEEVPRIPNLQQIDYVYSPGCPRG